MKERERMSERVIERKQEKNKDNSVKKILKILKSKRYINIRERESETA